MAEWIIAVASCVTAVTVIIIWLQFKADHERSRREKTIDLMAMWTERMIELSPGVRFARELVEYFNDRQCKDFWNLEPFKIDEKHRYLVVGSLNYETDAPELNTENGTIRLTQHQLSILRSLVSAYLNLLETVIGAWRHNVADREMIENEFSHLISPKDRDFPLRNLLVATGKFPSIKEFSEYLSQKQRKPTGKSRVA